MQVKKKQLNFKNIIIWRHAEAVPAATRVESEDLARMLTPKGKQQAKRMAAWLTERLPNDLVLLTSPALRAYQTVQALKNETKAYEIKVDESLKPTANLQEVLTVLQRLDDLPASHKNILLVGHQPWLWHLVSDLTGFSATDINIKKGAIWWLRQSSTTLDENTQRYSVIAVQTPSLLI